MRDSMGNAEPLFQVEQFLPSQMTPVTWTKTRDRQTRIFNPDQAQHRVARLVPQPTDLPVFSLIDGDGQPGLVLFDLQDSDVRWLRRFTLNIDALSPPLKANGTYRAPHLRVVDLLSSVTWVLQLSIKVAIIG